MIRTKIICTIGPASEQVSVIRQLFKNGLIAARFNFSHRDHRYHQKLINNVLMAAALEKKSVALIQDLQGPRMRVGTIAEGGLTLKKGEEVFVGDVHYFQSTDFKHADSVLSAKKIKRSHLAKKQKNSLPARQKLPIDFGGLTQALKPGLKVLIEDGLIELEIKQKLGEIFLSKVMVGGQVISHKNVNIPGLALEKGALSKKDKQDILFGLKNKIDFIALSFVRHKKDILELRQFISQKIQQTAVGRYYRQNNLIGPAIIAKIECREAVNSLDQIIEASDAIMVARGDLGLELPAEEVPLIQKKIIEKCLAQAKPVIVATQMLDSMIRNPRPTRAEVADVAAAVIDNTDAVMLSGETAFGQYPIEACCMMSKIINKTEESPYDNAAVKNIASENTLAGLTAEITSEEALAKNACLLAYKVGARLILAATLSGSTGRLISKFRPEIAIAVTTNSEIVARQMLLSWGVKPFVISPCRTMEELIRQAVKKVKAENLVSRGDKIIIIAGEPVGQAGANLLKVQKV